MSVVSVELQWRSPEAWTHHVRALEVLKRDLLQVSVDHSSALEGRRGLSDLQGHDMGSNWTLQICQPRPKTLVSAGLGLPAQGV